MTRGGEKASGYNWEEPDSPLWISFTILLGPGNNNDWAHLLVCTPVPACGTEGPLPPSLLMPILHPHQRKVWGSMARLRLDAGAPGFSFGIISPQHAIVWVLKLWTGS